MEAHCTAELPVSNRFTWYFLTAYAILNLSTCDGVALSNENTLLTISFELLSSV